jgi:hypothetical protein
MIKPQHIIEDPLDSLRPTWRSALVFAVLFVIATGAVIIGFAG